MLRTSIERPMPDGQFQRHAAATPVETPRPNMGTASGVSVHANTMGFMRTVERDISSSLRLIIDPTGTRSIKMQPVAACPV